MHIPARSFNEAKNIFVKKKIYSFVLRGFFFFMGFGSFGHLFFFFFFVGFGSFGPLVSGCGVLQRIEDPQLRPHYFFFWKFLRFLVLSSLSHFNVFLFFGASERGAYQINEIHIIDVDRVHVSLCHIFCNGDLCYPNINLRGGVI